MKTKLPSLAPVLLLLAACFVCAAVVAPVGAQGQCGIGNVSALNQFYNVRGTPGDTTKTPIATVQRGTSVPIASTRVVRGNEVWYGLCQGGYVSGAVVSFVTATPTRTATRTATVGASATASPTRHPSSTTGPTPTATATPSEPEVIVYTYEDGFIVIDGFCPRACLWSIRVENAP